MVSYIRATSEEGRADALARLQLLPSLIERLEQRERAGTFRFDGLFEARRDERLVGVAWGQLLPGRVAQMWPLWIAEGEPPETADSLVDVVHRFLRQQQVQLTQATLPSPASPDARRLFQQGYQYVTELLYLTWQTDPAAVTPAEAAAAAWTFSPYRPRESTELAQLVEASYQQTLDCPELNGRRRIEDILQGYEQSGDRCRALWFLVSHGGQRAGCLLLSLHEAQGQLELVYMGLVPAVRGRGGGRQLTRFAQQQAIRLQSTQIILGVDGRNQPALRHYLHCGFTLCDRRSVLLRFHE